MFECKQCHKDFKPKRTGKTPKFCSRDCYKASKQPTLNKCLQCGEQTKTKFCNKSCAATYNNTIDPKRKKESLLWRQCAKCGNLTKNKKHCSMECRKKYKTPEEQYKAKRAIYNEANARYMARRKFQTPADENIKALQEFYASCPQGYEVDHIIPISKGGLHSLSNLQYLTKEDNRRKSNKLTNGSG